ncbi:MAG: DNA repair protein RecN [Candidatus Syntrophosphaera sp.]|nr:DNA repair protein RecN [Candidatus Syntrophosphaera sp.]
MLTGIQIKNYLFVPEQRLDFGPGMTVLSGETGAGKSILVGSISLIFGDPSPPLEPFDPGQPIYLEASFDISANSELRSYLEEQGYDPEPELILSREVNTAGRSAYFLNGRKVTATLLRELKPLMIDFHHQRDQQRLLAASYQLQLLDLYAQNGQIKKSFASLFRKLKGDLRELDSLRSEEARNRQLSDLYRYQFEELEKASLRPDEDHELQQEFELLSHAKEIGETAGAAAFDLYDGEESVHTRISQAISGLTRFSALNQRIAKIEQGLRDCQETIADAASELGDLTSSISLDPSRLESVNERLDLINNLLYKHKAQSIEELLSLFQEREASIRAFADLSGKIQALEQEIGGEFQELRGMGDQLSKSRLEEAGQLSTELRDSISLLSIPDARFKISIDKKTDGKNLIPEYLDACSEQGQDACQFFFSANRGSELKPLSAVASGGELSRILLAIKKVLSERIEEKLMILDEIDAGIGGKTAEYVAQFIFRLAQRHRIICITHLAQIAAIAHQQIALQKEPGQTKNVIRMLPLGPEQRLEELARMLGGDVSPVSLRHAQELINKYRT